MNNKQAIIIFTVVTSVLALYSLFLNKSGDQEATGATTGTSRNRP